MRCDFYQNLIGTFTADDGSRLDLSVAAGQVVLPTNATICESVLWHVVNCCGESNGAF
jgi:hypothetical protein